MRLLAQAIAAVTASNLTRSESTRLGLRSVTGLIDSYVTYKGIYIARSPSVLLVSQFQILKYTRFQSLACRPAGPVTAAAQKDRIIGTTFQGRTQKYASFGACPPGYEGRRQQLILATPNQPEPGSNRLYGSQQRTLEWRSKRILVFENE